MTTGVRVARLNSPDSALHHHPRHHCLIVLKHASITYHRATQSQNSLILMLLLANIECIRYALKFYVKVAKRATDQNCWDNYYLLFRDNSVVHRVSIIKRATFIFRITP